MSASLLFIYESFSDKGVPSIRTVTIKSGPKGSKICCTLEAVSLQPFPDFKALSYVWGSPLDKKPIEIEDKNLIVTSKLERALHHLRNETTTRTFCIDAICIDQANLTERSEQVQFMAKIYGGAKQVILWLGCEDAYTKPAFRMARMLSASAIQSPQNPHLSHHKLGIDENAIPSDIHQKISLECFSSCAFLDLTSLTEEEMIAFENTFEHRECAPFILRQSVNTSVTIMPFFESKLHRLIGTAYVHGIMDREISEAVERGEEKKALFSLVQGYTF